MIMGEASSIGCGKMRVSAPYRVGCLFAVVARFAMLNGSFGGKWRTVVYLGTSLKSSHDASMDPAWQAVIHYKVSFQVEYSQEHGQAEGNHRQNYKDTVYGNGSGGLKPKDRDMSKMSSPTMRRYTNAVAFFRKERAGGGRSRSWWVIGPTHLPHVVASTPASFQGTPRACMTSHDTFGWGQEWLQSSEDGCFRCGDELTLKRGVRFS